MATCVIYTIVWTVSFRFMPSFQAALIFFRVPHTTQQKKNKPGYTKRQPQRGGMSIETSGSPNPKPRRGDMCTVLKIVQTLVYTMSTGQNPVSIPYWFDWGIVLSTIFSTKKSFSCQYSAPLLKRACLEDLPAIQILNWCD